MNGALTELAIDRRVLIAQPDDLGAALPRRLEQRVDRLIEPATYGEDHPASILEKIVQHVDDEHCGRRCLKAWLHMDPVFGKRLFH